MSADTFELIRRFCAGRAPGDHGRFREPVASACGAWTYATDGRILVRVPHCGGVPEASVCNVGALAGLVGTWDNTLAFRPVPEVAEPKASPCKRCAGTGKEYFRNCPVCSGRGWLTASGDDNSHHQLDCPRCDGRGRVKGSADNHNDSEECLYCHGRGVELELLCTDLGESRFNNAYLRLIATLPGAEIEASPKVAAVARFRFSGGIGFLMPVRKD